MRELQQALFALVLVLVTAVATGAQPRDCDELYAGITGANPAPAVVWAEMEAAGARHGVPPTLLAALAWQESPDPEDTSRRWVQFTRDGSPLISSDGRCGVGLMQVTGRSDDRQLEVARDWRAGVDEAASFLAEVYAQSQPADAGPPTDPAVAESWFGAVVRYNGFDADTVDLAYAEAVFANAEDPRGPHAALVPALPGLQTPVELFGDAYDPTSHRVRATTEEVVLTTDDGTVVDRRSAAEGWRPTRFPSPGARPAAPRVASAATPAAAALQLSHATFADAGAAERDGQTASFAILAREDRWPDSLAGAALAGTRGPILFVPSDRAIAPGGDTVSELHRLLGDGGTVYLLGGEAAVPAATEQVLVEEGFRALRLAGAERTATAFAVAEEVRRRVPESGTLLVARGFTTPADALTGGAAAGRSGLPLVLVGDTLAPADRDRIARLGPREAYVLGGEAAVPESVVSELRAAGLTVTRLVGAERHATAAAIAASPLWAGADGGLVAVDLSTSTDEAGGETSWAWALAAGSLGAALDAPQVGVFPDAAPVPTVDAVRAAGGTPDSPARVVIVGDAARAGTATRQTLADASRGS